MQFNPQDYETVKARKERFYKEHPDGRIKVELLHGDKILEYALFKATIFFDREDQKQNLPRAEGYAMELRDTELSTTKYGTKYESVNYSSWTENCEESAVGRALDNAGYSGNKKPSLEEMEKVKRMNSTMNKYNNSPKPTTTTKEDKSDDEVNEVRCPNCGGQMWDNRPKKATGEFNPAAPDFKCRDKSCGGVIWPPKDKPMAADGSDYITMANIDYEENY